MRFSSLEMLRLGYRFEVQLVESAHTWLTLIQMKEAK